MGTMIMKAAAWLAGMVAVGLIGWGFVWLVKDSNHDAAIKLCKEQMITALLTTRDGNSSLAMYTTCMKREGYDAGQ